jgi:mono/diheme cytochrome c family protein
VRIGVIAATAVAAALLVAGCGTIGRAPTGTDVAQGKQLFEQKCGTCHQLAAAGTKGTVGPDLDLALGRAYDHGFEASTVRDVVLGQMAYASPPMPREDALFPECKPGQSDGTDGCVVDQKDALHAVAEYVAGAVKSPPPLPENG